MEEGFWESKTSSNILQELKSCKNKINKYNDVNNEIDNLYELNELLFIEEDLEIIK